MAIDEIDNVVIAIAMTLFAIAWVTAIYGMIKNKGVRGAVFGTPIVRTIGEIDLGKRGFFRTRVKVHTLQHSAAGAPAVGIEYVTTAFLSWQMLALPLTRPQALQLNALVSQAAEQSS